MRETEGSPLSYISNDDEAVEATGSSLTLIENQIDDILSFSAGGFEVSENQRIPLSADVPSYMKNSTTSEVSPESGQTSTKAEPESSASKSDRSEDEAETENSPSPILVPPPLIESDQSSSTSTEDEPTASSTVTDEAEDNAKPRVLVPPPLAEGDESEGEPPVPSSDVSGDPSPQDLQEKYASIADVGERAYAILKDLGMV